MSGFSTKRLGCMGEMQRGLCEGVVSCYLPNSNGSLVKKSMLVGIINVKLVEF